MNTASNKNLPHQMSVHLRCCKHSVFACICTVTDILQLVGLSEAPTSPCKTQNTCLLTDQATVQTTELTMLTVNKLPVWPGSEHYSTRRHSVEHAPLPRPTTS